MGTISLLIYMAELQHSLLYSAFPVFHRIPLFSPRFVLIIKQARLALVNFLEKLLMFSLMYISLKPPLELKNAGLWMGIKTITDLLPLI